MTRSDTPPTRAAPLGVTQTGVQHPDAVRPSRDHPGTSLPDTTRSDLLGTLGHVSRPLIWFGLLGAPIIWFVQINLGLAFAALGCATGSKLASYLLNLVVVLVVLAALWVTLRLRGMHDQPDEVTGRVTHYLGRFGAWHNAIFLILTVMTAVAALFLPACRVR